MIDAAALLAALKPQVATLEADLRGRTDSPGDTWGNALRVEHDAARARGRTALSWLEWREGEVAQAAVAWVLATVFIRFAEDNALIDGVWLAGSGARLDQAADNETAFYQAEPSRNARDWLRAAFAALASLPAGRGLVDPDHSLVWRADISADCATSLLNFWRGQDSTGAVVHDLTDSALDTRFLGDLYQDLSVHAKKKYALLQTPVFVEEFILDRTLTPALAEFGLDGFKAIDPTCGSGHFVTGTFHRLLTAWEVHAPALDRRERVQRALDAVHGVDINPFAVAIARFRLTIAAMQASGIDRLADAPAFRYHLAVGDSLLGGLVGRQTELDLTGDGGAQSFHYAAEDLEDYPGILERGSYAAVTGNPPYVTVKDPALNEAYRAAYTTCKGKYALSVPFMELFFALAKRGDASGPAGYVGQITSNSFMKREFGSKLIEDLLAGTNADIRVDLTEVVDTSGAYIPGHGTPTVILIGRQRFPVLPTVRGVLGVRGEPGQPDDPAMGLVWTEIVNHVDTPGYNGGYVTVTDLERRALATHPWSLSGGQAGAVKSAIEATDVELLKDRVSNIGFAAITGEDEFFLRGGCSGFLRSSNVTTRGFVEGEQVRDFSVRGNRLAIFPYPVDTAKHEGTVFWPFRAVLRKGLAFGQTREDRGMWWGEYILPNWARLDAPLLLTFAFVSTHNHVVLDRGGKVFKQSAPVIKLADEAGEDEYFDLLGVLNSSAACFWLRQVCHGKGNGGVNEGMRGEDWEEFYEFTGTKLQEFPLPAVLPRARAAALDGLAQDLTLSLPAAVVGRGAMSRMSLDVSHVEADAIRRAMVMGQEELDWAVYQAYGLVNGEWTYRGDDMPSIALGERAFEIALARRVASGEEETAWFERHGSTPITGLPAPWPEAYRDLVLRRLDLIESDPRINLLERPEYKRRWASESWEKQEQAALASFALDRLEDSGLWRDAAGVRVASVGQLADRVRHDELLVEALRLLAGAVEVDVTAELTKLLVDEAVPFLAAYRYSEAGMRKRAVWEQVWALQRREDAGERVDIAVPPKYSTPDFRTPSYWKARGKLDVPKERFVLYPGAGRGADPTPVLGWAGWDHLEKARALTTLIVERTSHEGWGREQLLPLLAGVAELEPWLHQWHADSDAAYGMSPAAFFTTYLDSQLGTFDLTREDLAAWRPPAPTRGRRPVRAVAVPPSSELDEGESP